MSGTPKLRLAGLAKAFGGKAVLNGVELDVPTGLSTVIIGASGSGKSVTLKCILGLLDPDRGRIEVDGIDMAGDRGRQERFRDEVGMLFQGAALFDSLPVWQNVAFRLLQSGVPRREARAVAIAKLGQVGLGPDVADLAPAELSGGMQKRVGLARAIARDPAVLFFDEPTTGLDPIMSAVINELIVSCVKGLGATALSITHDMASVRRIADRVAMLHGGRIIWQGTAAEMEQSGNPVVDQFIHGRAEGPIRALAV